MIKEKQRNRKGYPKQPLESSNRTTKKRAQPQSKGKKIPRNSESDFKNRELYKQTLSTHPTRPGKGKDNKRKKLTKEQFEKMKKRKRRKMIMEIIKFTFPIIIVAFCVFFFILKTSPHRVDGSSMAPTLKNRDHVIVSRNKNPKRYEVITFKPPVKSDYQYVKRIIGMPGDHIWIEGSSLFINQQVKENSKDKIENATGLPDGTIKLTVTKKTAEQLEDMKKIPKGFYFVLGDNRTNSSDSRDFGLVDKYSIEGVVTFRIAPMKSFGWIK